MVGEAQVIEAQLGVETSRTNPFQKMQVYLRENGSLKTHTIPNTGVQVSEYQHNGSVTFTEKALIGGEESHRMDLYIKEELPAANDGSHYDINITLKDRSLYEKNLRKKDMPGQALTEIVLVNPASGKKTRAMIYQFNPINRWLGFSKQKWQEDKDAAGSIWITESDEEALKIVKLMTAGEIQSSGAQFGRREFVKLLAAASAGALILPKIPVFLKKKTSPEETAGAVGVSTEDLKREVESQFDIKVVGPSSGIKEVEYSIGREYPTIEWDNLSLASLRSVLSQLPRHFYSSGLTDEKKKAQFTLIKTPLDSEKEWEIGICFCSEAERHLIVLTRGMLVEDTKAKNQFTLAELGGPMGVLAHELTHSITARDMNKFIKAIIEPLDISEEGIQSFFSSEFEDPFHYPILGPFPMEKDGDYNDYYEKKDDYITIEDKFIVSKNDYLTLGGKYFREDTEDIWKRYSQTLTQERLEKGGPFWTYRVTSYLQTKTRLGYGAKNTGEFLSVAAEIYIKGGDQFIKSYEPFLGKERAEKLYEGMKQEIFRGKEY